MSYFAIGVFVGGLLISFVAVMIFYAHKCKVEKEKIMLQLAGDKALEVYKMLKWL